MPALNSIENMEQTGNKKSVSVIIPNYNGRKLLGIYLPYTFEALKNANINFEVIVVDDCSKDDSVTYLQQAYPDIILRQMPANGGFSKACNEGIKTAQKELILVLNSDVKLSPDYFEHLWPYFADKDTFGVMGRIANMHDDGIQDAARLPKKSGVKLKVDQFYYLDEGEKTLTLYLSGANALVDAKKLKELGGFNRLFSPFYGEDMELSLRAWRLNWTCYYEHRAICRHELSASTKNYKTARWVKMIYFRNRYFVHALHLNGSRLWLWFLQVTFIDLIPKIFTGKFWLAKSYVEFLKHLKDVRVNKQDFAALMAQHNSITSVQDIIAKINTSIKGKHVTQVDI
jgi:GT2 family glycosyltransferase